MRLLLITRHYPPAVSGGAKRPFLLAERFRHLGADVFIVAPSLPEGEAGLAVPHPHRDPSLSPAPTGFDLRNAAREALLWPDPDIRWCLRAASEAARAAPWRPDWVWTTSPPESIHAAGLRLKQRFSASWWADFRDHWLERPHRRERHAPHRQIGEAMIARNWLSKVDLATAVDESIAAELQHLGAADPLIAPHFAPSVEAEPIELAPHDLNVVHTGSIGLSDPEARIEDLLTPFAAALTRNPTLHLHLVGRLTEAEQSAINASPAGARITIHGVQPLARALGFQQAADALILVGSAKMHVPPSKIAEYLATEAPVIACGDGPWRRDPRLAFEEAGAMLSTLAKGQRRNAAPPPPSTDDVAGLIWARLRQ